MSAEELGFDSSVERAMADIAIERARQWQTFFDNLVDFSNLEALTEQAIREMDEAFPYINSAVLISGNRIRPVLDDVTKEPISEEFTYGPGTLAKHLGFTVLSIEADDNTKQLRVMHVVFESYRESRLYSTVHQTLRYYEYFDLDSVLIVPDELNRLFYGSSEEEHDFEAQMSIVWDQSLEVNRILCSRSFRRLDISSQRKLLDELVAETESLVSIRGTEILAEGDYGYANVLRKSMEIIPFNIGNVVIGGTCLGIESIESLTLRSRPIRKPSDLIDRYAGLCLVLDPNEETRHGLNLPEDQVFYLPTCQNIELEVVSDDY